MSEPNPTETFLIEAEELLIQIEQSALDVSNGLDAEESINRLFRAFHTIKGSGAMFGFEAVAGFTHHIETVLEQVREERIDVSPEMIDLILASKDQIKALLEGADPSTSEALVKKLVALQGAPVEPVASVPKSGAEQPETGRPETYRITFRPAANIASTGLDPTSLLDELRTLGSCQIILDTDSVPPLDRLNADHCYLAWTITLTTDQGINAIRDVFIFVEDDSELTIEPVAEFCLANSQATRDTMRESFSTTVPNKAQIEPNSAAPVRKPSSPQSIVRVPSEKLDRLVNLVGELVMNQSRLSQVADGLESPDLAVPVEAIERLVSELRDSVLGIRMMPIGSTFSRFRRLVHDLSHELEKDIELVTEGEETELDKTVLDQLGDPLVHLIRNSVDHGLESPQERIAQGKPRCGVVRMTAAHEGAQVVVTISDDGKGLDTERLRGKAIEKGLIQPEANLAESDLFNLILLPGFSTAKAVTNVSGRGVGMDVVKRQIEALRGGIKIASKRGKGTTISLTLPLTLAIIDGLLVEIGRDRFILPMSAVTENVEISKRERSTNNGRNLISVRGELVPYVRLRELFSSPGEAPNLEKIVIANFDGERIGFVVDRVLGSHQTVIQSLGHFYEDIEVASGATILGDGRVALILDIGGILRHDRFRLSTASRNGDQYLSP